MKMQYTVIAEFPTSVPHEKVENLVCKYGLPADRQNATVTSLEARPSGGSPGRYHLKWEMPCIDARKIPSNAMFAAGSQLLAKYGIRLNRTIQKLDLARNPESELKSTVFWTWGDDALIEALPAP